MSESKAYKIIFAGSPDFALPTLAALEKSAHEVIAVITQEDKPVGRRQIMTETPVKQFAKARGIKVYDPQSLKLGPETAELAAEDCDFLITAAYGKLMPRWILDLPRIKALNVHASLLPKYRGAAPVQAAVLNGDEEAGVSIMEMVEELDAGPVYWQERIKLEAEESGGSLFSKLAELGAKALLNCLTKWPELQPEAQDESQVTFTKKLDRAAGKIDWSKTALEIERLIRAYYPWPSAHCFLEGERFIVWQAELIAKSKQEALSYYAQELGRELSPSELLPGTVIVAGKQMTVICGAGALNLIEVQKAGQKRILAQELAHNLPLGTVLV
ncbi:MAG: methionyl-tRNA formyltransferase [Eubacteriales bacterium]|nr:methionyl-tRNA formyltransferase [Eubacteriales bacterium]